MAEFERSDEGLVVTGPLDVEAEAKFRRHLRVLLDSDAEALTLDLSKVKYISSICVGSLVSFWIDLRPKGRRMKIVPSPIVRKVLDMVGLSGVFAKAASVRKAPPAEESSSKRAHFDDDSAGDGDSKAEGDSAAEGDSKDEGGSAGDDQ